MESTFEVDDFYPYMVVKQGDDWTVENIMTGKLLGRFGCHLDLAEEYAEALKAGFRVLNPGRA